jgi:hypothetical protein
MAGLLPTSPSAAGHNLAAVSAGTLGDRVTFIDLVESDDRSFHVSRQYRRLGRRPRVHRTLRHGTQP